MKLISYNIQYGMGKDGRYDLARIAGEIEGGDVIALQEVERFWQRSGERDEPVELAHHLRRFHWVYGANLDMDASCPDEDGFPVHRRRQFGTMILSRTPIISSRNFPLPKFGTLRQHSIQQGALEAVIRSERGTPLRVYSTHLSHLSPATRLPQVEALLAIHRRAPSEGGAWCGGHPSPEAGWTEGAMPPMPREAVLMGDFNFRPEAEEYRRIVGPDTDGYGRLNNLEGFVDSWVAAGHAEHAGATCGGARIDYIFVVAAWQDRIRSAWIDERAQGSDHQPIGIELDV
jgi:endonuclease/exonuclease/phosphatase family metal-dependent hydrolase